MGPCWHPTRAKCCVCTENADMHLAIRFQRSNTDFGVSHAAYLRQRIHSKTAVELPASWSNTFFDIFGENVRFREICRKNSKLPKSPVVNVVMLSKLAGSRIIKKPSFYRFPFLRPFNQHPMLFRQQGVNKHLGQSDSDPDLGKELFHFLITTCFAFYCFGVST